MRRPAHCYDRWLVALAARLEVITAELNFERLKQDFDRDGFVVLRGYLSPEELAEMWDPLHRYHARVEGPFTNGEPTRAIKGMNVHDDWHRNYLEHGRHIPPMKYLIEDDLAPDNVTWLQRPKGVHRTMPHFDAIGSYRSPLPGIYSGISLWIALDRIDLNNGCLHYERGSHKRDKPFVYPLPHYDEQNTHAVPVEVEPGDAVMHTALTVHWTFDPIEYRDRNAMVFVYWGASSAVDPMGAKKSRSAYADGATTL